MNVCVYAITSSRRIPRIAGARAEPLRAVRAGTLTAIVGDVRRSAAPTPANLRRYHHAIAAIAAAMPAMLPARFGTVMEEDELLLVLRMRAKALAAAVRRVRGRVQMTLRVAHGQANSGAVQRSSRASGAAYLRSRAAEAARERDVPTLMPVRAAVQRWLRDEHVERHGPIASVYHLVPRASVVAYSRAARKAADAAGVRVIISGPYPPYAFTAL